MNIQLDLYNSDHFKQTVVLPYNGSQQLDSVMEVVAPELKNLNLSLAKDSEESRTIVTPARCIELVPARGTKVSDWQTATQTFFSKRGKELGSTWHMYTEHLASQPELLEASVRGLVLGTYKQSLYKTDDNNADSPVSAILFCPESSGNNVDRAIATAETQKEIFALVNAPSNRKDPVTLAEWAVSSGEKYNYRVDVMEIEQLRQEGFEGLLAVNRGSEVPAKFIICDYDPADAVTSVGLVGKGVTFDTGGISLKPANNMHYMKSDMGGAAAVLGAVELVAKLGLPIRVTGFVPTTDNSIGTKAIKPGDVIGSYSGKTIEVLNTDAEGRLILADGLSYSVRKYKPDYLVDLATLTGSVVRALGNYCAGLFTANDELADALLAAGNTSGERLWRLPLWQEYREDMSSDIADIKNLSAKPIAGSITAAKFLEEFTDEHPKWAHIDIAGVAFKGNGIVKSYAATAFGVNLLYAFIESLTK